MRDAFLEHMENRSACCDYDEPQSDAFEQTVRSAVASFYHTNLVTLIRERVGEGEPLDILLNDSFYREKFNLKPRQL